MCISVCIHTYQSLFPYKNTPLSMPPDPQLQQINTFIVSYVYVSRKNSFNIVIVQKKEHPKDSIHYNLVIVMVVK